MAAEESGASDYEWKKIVLNIHSGKMSIEYVLAYGINFTVFFTL